MPRDFFRCSLVFVRPALILAFLLLVLSWCSGVEGTALAQTVVEKKIEITVNGEVRSIYDPQQLRQKDVIEGRFRFFVTNNSNETRWVTFRFVGLHNGEFVSAADTGSSVSRGGTVEITHKLNSDNIKQRLKGTLEYRWYLGYEDSLKKEPFAGGKDAFDYHDLLNCSGRLFLNKAPAAPKILVNQIQTPYEHDANWLGLCKAEVVDAIFQQRRRGIIKDGSELADKIDQIGETFSARFREIIRQQKEKELEHEDQSLAFAVAYEKQWSALESALNPKQLNEAIRTGILQKLANVHLQNHPGDTAYLSHPKIIAVINLNDETATEIQRRSETLSEEIKKDIKRFSEELPQWEQNNRPQGRDNRGAARDKFKALRQEKIDEHIKSINQRKAKAFKEMTELLSDEQKILYQKHIGLKVAAPYQYDDFPY